MCFLSSFVFVGFRYFSFYFQSCPFLDFWAASQQAFQTQKHIEQEARSLQVQATKFTKQTSQWMAAIKGFDNALKELGDFENYVKALEWEIQTVASALEHVDT